MCHVGIVCWCNIDGCLVYMRLIVRMNPLCIPDRSHDHDEFRIGGLRCSLVITFMNGEFVSDQR